MARPLIRRANRNPGHPDKWSKMVRNGGKMVFAEFLTIGIRYAPKALGSI
jgi:hypothetical protein